MTKAMYAGSFDPVTNGHLDIIQRAARIFDKLVIVVAVNTNKKALFTQSERVHFIKEAVKNLPNVSIIESNQLLVHEYQKQKCDVLIRGIRDSADVANESRIAGMNHFLDNKVETVFIPTNPKYNFISASLVKEVLKMGGDISGLVPEIVNIRLKEKRLEK